MKSQRKPGTWSSPLSAAMLAEAGNVNLWPQVVGDDLWWDEMRPSEEGRTLIVSRQHGDLLKAPWNASTQVHEYGGLSWLGVVSNGKSFLYFVNKSDQRIYVTEVGGEPQPITPIVPAGEIHRYAEMIYVNGEIWCVREKHEAGVVSRSIVAISANEIRVLDSNSHFYAHLRVSPDGSQLAWVCWEHPQMPWDGTEIKVADLANGVLSNSRVVAGGIEESCLGPEWANDGMLYYISDQSGWWNLWSIDKAGAKRQIIKDESEWGYPLWWLGFRFIQVLEDGKIFSSRGPVDSRSLVIVDPAAGTYVEIDSPLSDFMPAVAAGNGKAYAFGGGATVVSELVEVDLATLKASTVFSTKPPIEAKYFPNPHEVTATRPDGRKVYAILHPATHPDFEPSEKTPLMVVVHGGPTAHAASTLSMNYAYFTSRGIAVVDVNYGGSTGYGREYRNLLRGTWGIVDREDVIAIVDSLIADGKVDADKILIRGGSAGGFTVLNVLVNSDHFAAGASYYGVADCAALATDTHDFESRYLDSLIGKYPEDAALYAERSPLTHADRLSSPLIIFQGLDDKVVPPAQSEAFRDVCVRKGIKHEYHPFEGEGHGFHKASSIITSMESEMKFYGEVLGFEPELN
jgi:dipeptidyl aminopeptidase/acylaminoacyl peptidase